MAGLTVHVLDIMNGIPGGGMRIDFLRLDGTDKFHLKTLFTNAEGRTDEPVLTSSDMMSGTFELMFHVKDYFRRGGTDATFFELVPVRFKIVSTHVHHHVPLVVAPWGYQSYMGT
ncbi:MULTISPECIES: hydroxyisourate hydrolase [Aminobacter]|uniref:5-hydroxyisourate hydrolase n=1 Tax=Pseudomonas sp. (strain CBB1) TaxID=765715 RepID=I7A7N1_PSEU3|nr:MULTISPECIES: hydroxyisourate hydrolase [Aminobacter]AFO10116.1 TmuH [Pseudomonas sp. CBB1]MDR7224607.1 5-hydroxyisourate hydrolase [Aminobacter aminovorans]MRX37331.1 hydroxyisourate hydrolase [Aminobacter sp. MDW-2]QNH33938.1 hydroxyisourate hydrolase [Aminobacter sp. MDW-2]